MRGFALAGIALLSSCAAPPPSPIVPSEVASTSSLPTREYFDAVTSYHLFVVRSAELALERSEDPFFLQYAREMIRVHGALRAELAAAGRKLGLKPAAELHPSHIVWLHQLASADGPVLFDAWYPRNQSSAHEAGRRLHGAYGLHGDDETLRRIAARLMQISEEHERTMRMRPLGTGR